MKKPYCWKSVALRLLLPLRGNTEWTPGASSLCIIYDMYWHVTQYQYVSMCINHLIMLYLCMVILSNLSICPSCPSQALPWCSPKNNRASHHHIGTSKEKFCYGPCKSRSKPGRFLSNAAVFSIPNLVPLNHNTRKHWFCRDLGRFPRVGFDRSKSRKENILEKFASQALKTSDMPKSLKSWHELSLSQSCTIFVTLEKRHIGMKWDEMDEMGWRWMKGLFPFWG